MRACGCCGIVWMALAALLCGCGGGNNEPPANQPPSVSLAAPATASSGVAVILAATAADSDGSIASVDFYDGSTLLGTDRVAPFS